MTIVTKTIEEMLAEIEFTKWIRYDILSMKASPELHEEVIGIAPKNVAAKLNLQTLPYEELPEGFHHVTPPKNWKDKWAVIKHIYVKKDWIFLVTDLMGFGNIIPVKEAYLNAYWWGNNADCSLPLSVKVFEGAKGKVLRVRDSGVGFDYREILEKRSRGEKGFVSQGKGFENFIQDESYNVAYEGNGSIVNLQMFK